MKPGTAKQAYFVHCLVVRIILVKLICPTAIALTSNTAEMHYLNSRRNGGRGCQPPNSS